MCEPTFLWHLNNLLIIVIIHTFLMSGRLTNEDHLETRTLLHQTLVFWSLTLDHTDVDGNWNSPIYPSSAKLPQGLTSLLASSMSYTLAFSSFSHQHSIGGGMKPLLYLPLPGKLIMQWPIPILSSWFSQSNLWLSLQDSPSPPIMFFTECLVSLLLHWWL